MNAGRWKDRKRTIGEMCGREPIVRDIEVKGVLTKSNLPVGDGSVSSLSSAGMAVSTAMLPL